MTQHEHEAVSDSWGVTIVRPDKPPIPVERPTYANGYQWQPFSQAAPSAHRPGFTYPPAPSLVGDYTQGRVSYGGAFTRPGRCIVIPYPRNEDIIIRPDAFAELDTLLPPTPEYRSAALWGVGGSGKTQIALEYAYRRCDDPTWSVFWVYADNEATFTQDYKIIARRLGLDSKFTGEELLTAVRGRIEAEPRWLLILDNADDLSLFGVDEGSNTTRRATSLLDYIPQGSTGTVLWTSCDERIVGTVVGPRRGIQVASMTIEEATSLLETARNKRTGPKVLTDTRALLKELDYLPLAITQAGAYMQRTSTSVKEYLLRLAAEKELWCILRETEFNRYRRTEVPNTILGTWSISIERIRQENEIAYKVLHILAYLGNQDIPFEIIATAAKFGRRPKKRWPTNKRQVHTAIIQLEEFSFLGAYKTEGGERSFQMHKLVQAAARYSLTTRRFQERKRTKLKPRLSDLMKIPCGKQIDTKRGSREDKDDVYFSNGALRIMIDLFPEHKREMWLQCEKYLRHTIQVCDWAEICGKEVEASNLLTQLTNDLCDGRSWREKEAVDKRALGLRQQALGEKHPDTIFSMVHLAKTYIAQGRYENAEEIYVKVLEKRQEVLGEKHPDTLQAMYDLARVWRSQGRGGRSRCANEGMLSIATQYAGAIPSRYEAD